MISNKHLERVVVPIDPRPEGLKAIREQATNLLAHPTPTPSQRNLEDEAQRR